jgi:hypothetical protein
MMRDLLRAALRTSTIVVIGMTGWLVAVIVGVLPERDPSSIGLWTSVAAGAGGLAMAALLATLRRNRPGAALGGAFGVLSAAAAAFGLFVLTSLALPSRGGHVEGYLPLIGLILAVEGVLGLSWLASLGTARR